MFSADGALNGLYQGLFTLTETQRRRTFFNQQCAVSAVCLPYMSGQPCRGTVNYSKKARPRPFAPFGMTGGVEPVSPAE